MKTTASETTEQENEDELERYGHASKESLFRKGFESPCLME